MTDLPVTLPASRINILPASVSLFILRRYLSDSKSIHRSQPVQHLQHISAGLIDQHQGSPRATTSLAHIPRPRRQPQYQTRKVFSKRPQAVMRLSRRPARTSQRGTLLRHDHPDLQLLSTGTYKDGHLLSTTLPLTGRSGAILQVRTRTWVLARLRTGRPSPTPTLFGDREA